MKSPVWLRCGMLRLGLLAAVALAQTQLASPQLETDALRIAFDAQTGAVTHFTGRLNRHEFIEPHSAISLWHIEFMDGKALEPEQTGAFSWESRGFCRCRGRAHRLYSHRC